MKSILFVSCVNSWGRSEILWSETAIALADKGYTINFAVRYKNPIIQKLKSKGASYIDLSRIESIQERALRKIKLKRHPFLKSLLKEKPQLVIISQGNNVHGEYYLTSCRQLGIPYVTITQLINNILWSFIDDKVINELRIGYAGAQANYFVSQSNLDLYIIMMGEEHSNAKVILNPFTVPVEVSDEYPPVIGDQYNIALVGRLETFHK